MATDTLPSDVAATGEPNSGMSATMPTTAMAAPPGAISPGKAATPLALTPAVLLAAACSAVVVLAFAPMVQLHAIRLWERPHYQFFPWLIIGAVALAWSGMQRLTLPLLAGNSGVALAGITGSWILLAAGEIFYSPTLAAVAALLLLEVLIYAIGGLALVRAWLPAWVFLWLTIPPPFGLDNRIVGGLQTITSQLSSAALDTLGVLHLLEGNVIRISGQRLLVEEACAGVSSLFSLLACTLFLVFWLRRPWLRAALLLASAVGWVIVSNTVRVTTIAFLFDHYHLDLSRGLKHDLLGYGCFGLAVLLIWSTDRLVLFTLPRSALAPTPPTPVAVDTGLATHALQGLVRVMSLPMALAFGLLFLLHAATYGLIRTEGSLDLLPGVAKLSEQSLPDQLAGWKRAGFTVEKRDRGSPYGENSKLWVYERGARRAFVALDYPFPSYHVLNECYLRQGWTQLRNSEHRSDKKDGTLPFWVEVDFTKAGLQTGHLFYSECSEKGAFLEHESDSLRSFWKRYETAIEGWRHSWSEPAEADRVRGNVLTYQFQLFLEEQRPLTTEERESARQLFFQAVQRLRGELYPGS